MNSITKVPRESRWSVFYLLAALAVLAALVAAPSAYATNGYQTTWRTIYSGTTSSTDASCQLCHGNDTGDLNPYGFAISPRCSPSGWADITAGINGAEGVNSDNDAGANSNLAEINASAQPGWTTGTNTTWDRGTNAGGSQSCTQNNIAETAPAGLTTLDPAPTDVPPVANDDSATTNQDTAVLIDVVANDTDADGDLDPTTVAVTSAPANGSVVNNGDGTVTYTPNTGFFSPPNNTFTYTVDDLAGNTSNTATVTVTVNQVIPNQPPVANDDAATTNQDVAVTIDVVANDTDVNGDLDPTSVALTSTPANGTVVNNNDGTVTYSPNAGFFSPPNNTFTYTVSDLAGNTSNTATVTVTVNEVIANQPPQANDDSATTNQDTPVTINVVANDTDVNGDLDPTSVAVTSAPANGTVVNNNDGTVTYSPNAGSFSPPNDTFTYTVDDLAGNTSNTATVTVTVNEVVAAACEGITIDNAEWRTNGNGQLRVSGTGERDGVFELLGFDPAEVIATTSGNNGRFNFNVNGRNLNAVPCRVRVLQPELLLCGEADVDNAGDDCEPLEPFVPPVVPDPLTARGDTYATPVGDPITVTASRVSGVLYNDFGGVPPLSTASLTNPALGTLVFDADGLGGFTYSPGPGMTDNVVDSFTYQVTDAEGSTAEATVTIQALSKQTDFKIMMNYELGMHCTGFEFAYCCVLPPYNSILAQVVKPAQGDPATADDEFVDGFPRLLEGDPNVGTDGLSRQTVVRDWDHTDNSFQKYQLRYYHDAQPRQEGNTGKPNTSTLISAAEGNSLQYFNTVFDSACVNVPLDGTDARDVGACAEYDPSLATNALVYGAYNGYQNALQGDGTLTPNDPVSAGPGGTTTDNYANAWLNHFYIYVDPDNPTPIGPNLEGHGNTGLEADKIRLGVAGQVAYPPDSGAALQPMGPTGNGAFENLLTFSGDTGTVVYTQMKVLEDLPVMLTSPRIWEALGLPLTTFEDTIGFFADPGAVDEDAVRPFVAMKASLHYFGGNNDGEAVMGSNQQPVIGFGTAPIDIPNCERCHSAPSINADTGLPNVNSPNFNRPDAIYPHFTGTVPFGTGLEDMTNLEYNFWLAYYDIVPGVDSDWYARLKGAAINMLTLHDYDVGTSFTASYAGVDCTNNLDPTDPNIDPQSYDCSYLPFDVDGNLNLGDLTNQADIPQNTRLGHESVICQRCHADNVIANVKSATEDPAGAFPIKPITEAIHNRHRNAGDPALGGEGGSIVFNDSLGRDGGCQGCHPAHRSDGVMDDYPITLDGDNANADNDNRLNLGGCFVGRDVHSNPLKDVDGAETDSYLNALGNYLLTNVSQDQGEARGMWCTNCHSQVGQEMWKAENCVDLINNDCAPGENPRAAADMPALAAALGTTLAQLESWADPKNPLIDDDLPLSGPDTRTGDFTHAVWDPDPGLCDYVSGAFGLTPVNPAHDGNVATVEVNIGSGSGTCSNAGDANAVAVPVNCGFVTFDICGSTDPDGDFNVNAMDFCTTPDCVAAAQATLNSSCTPAGGERCAVPVPFSAATDGRDHWLSSGEPHCADCHAAPYVEQSGNVTPYPPFNYPRKASLMRYTRGHQDVSCQGCHESIHGLYPVTPAIDTTSYAQAAALNNDGSHGPIKCEACHTHVDGDGIPNWVDDLVYTDPMGVDSGPVSGNFERAVGWMHTYTDEADPAADVCQNCHGAEVPHVNGQKAPDYLEHAMTSRTSRVAMDNAERAVNGGLVYGEFADPENPAPAELAQRNHLCSNCHGDDRDNKLGEEECGGEWREHLIQGRVSEVVWEELSAPLGGCGW